MTFDEWWKQHCKRIGLSPTSEIRRVFAESGWNAAAERAAKLMESRCCCKPEYKERELIDPSCDAHDAAAAIRKGEA